MYRDASFIARPPVVAAMSVPVSQLHTLVCADVDVNNTFCTCDCDADRTVNGHCVGINIGTLRLLLITVTAAG